MDADWDEVSPPNRELGSPEDVPVAMGLDEAVDPVATLVGRLDMEHQMNQCLC